LCLLTLEEKKDPPVNCGSDVWSQHHAQDALIIAQDRKDARRQRTQRKGLVSLPCKNLRAGHDADPQLPSINIPAHVFWQGLSAFVLVDKQRLGSFLKPPQQNSQPQNNPVPAKRHKAVLP
jgi:hypothetical protein